MANQASQNALTWLEIYLFSFKQFLNYLPRWNLIVFKVSDIINVHASNSRLCPFVRNLKSKSISWVTHQIPERWVQSGIWRMNLISLSIKIPVSYGIPRQLSILSYKLPNSVPKLSNRWLTLHSFKSVPYIQCRKQLHPADAITPSYITVHSIALIYLQSNLRILAMQKGKKQ